MTNDKLMTNDKFPMTNQYQNPNDKKNESVKIVKNIEIAKTLKQKNIKTQEQESNKTKKQENAKTQEQKSIKTIKQESAKAKTIISELALLKPSTFNLKPIPVLASELLPVLEPIVQKKSQYIPISNFIFSHGEPDIFQPQTLASTSTITSTSTSTPEIILDKALNTNATSTATSTATTTLETILDKSQNATTTPTSTPEIILDEPSNATSTSTSTPLENQEPENSPTYLSGELATSTTLLAENNPYIIEENFLVPENIILTINPGVIILIKTKNIGLTVDGTLIINGTKENPVKFTSSNKTPQPGDYGQALLINKTSKNTVLDNVIFEYGDKILDHIIPMVSIQGADVKIINAVFREAKDLALSLTDSNSVIENTVFENNKTTALSIKGGQVEIKECQFKNNYVGIEVKNGSNVIFKNNIYVNNEYSLFMGILSNINLEEDMQLLKKDKQLFESYKQSIQEDIRMLEKKKQYFEEYKQVAERYEQLLETYQRFLEEEKQLSEEDSDGIFTFFYPLPSNVAILLSKINNWPYIVLDDDVVIVKAEDMIAGLATTNPDPSLQEYQEEFANKLASLDQSILDEFFGVDNF